MTRPSPHGQARAAGQKIKYFQNIPRTLHAKFHEDITNIDKVIQLFPTLEKEKKEKKKTVSDEASPRKKSQEYVQRGFKSQVPTLDIFV